MKLCLLKQLQVASQYSTNKSNMSHPAEIISQPNRLMVAKPDKARMSVLPHRYHYYMHTVGKVLISMYISVAKCYFNLSYMHKKNVISCKIVLRPAYFDLNQLSQLP